MSRWALAEYEDGRVRCCALDERGAAAGPVWTAGSAAEAVRRWPEAERWVWRSTAALAPGLLAAGVRVERAYDVESAEAVLLGYAGRFGAPRSLAAARARLHGLPVPEDVRAAAPDHGQPSLFETAPPPLPDGADPLLTLVEVYGDQVRRAAGTARPERMRLLLAAESAGTLVAAEINRTGLPWRADIHRRLLDDLLGEQPGHAWEPRRLTELAGEVSAAFGRPVRPDLPAEVITAFRSAGIVVRSTRSRELTEVSHPAVAPLLEYKKLYRIHTAHGREWLRSWVRDGRFHTQYVPGGAASGRWTTAGGGALQIPRVIRRAVHADPGWRLVVADADQLEPRVLAAMSQDPALTRVAAQDGDLYTAVSRELSAVGDREHAKLAVLGAIYGQTSGSGLTHLNALRRRFPVAVATVDTAARAGERGELVRTHLGRTCPPAVPPEDDDEPGPAGAAAHGSESGAARARGRFTRNFVVQGSAADWALLMLAALRRHLTGMRAELVFFQHDEVIVHCPSEEAGEVAAAITAAAATAGKLTFAGTPVCFPFSVSVVDAYDQAGQPPAASAESGAGSSGPA